MTPEWLEQQSAEIRELTEALYFLASSGLEASQVTDVLVASIKGVREQGDPIA